MISHYIVIVECDECRRNPTMMTGQGSYEESGVEDQLRAWGWLIAEQDHIGRLHYCPRCKEKLKASNEEASSVATRPGELAAEFDRIMLNHAADVKARGNKRELR